MLGIVGTVPDPSFPLAHGKVVWSGGNLSLDGHTVPVRRGTPALMAAAASTAESLGGPGIHGFLVGDIGKGDGSRLLYRFLAEKLPGFSFDVLTFHYLQPDVDGHCRVLLAAEAMKTRPVLIADAGFMYAAKMSGQAESYDLFTPDAGELAFLADEQAPHPFYTRGFVLHEDNDVPDLVRRAYHHGNAARYLLVKGKSDVVADRNGVMETVDLPSFAAMEAIGGTGDTLTGIVSALCAAGFGVPEAAVAAARTNRWTGHFCRPDPATRIADLIRTIPRALAEVLGRSPPPHHPKGGEP